MTGRGTTAPRPTPICSRPGLLRASRYRRRPGSPRLLRGARTRQRTRRWPDRGDRGLRRTGGSRLPRRPGSERTRAHHVRPAGCCVCVLHVRHALLHERGDRSRRRRERGAAASDGAGVGHLAYASRGTTSSGRRPPRVGTGPAVPGAGDRPAPQRHRSCAGAGQDPARRAVRRDPFGDARRALRGRRQIVALLGAQPVGQSSAAQSDPWYAIVTVVPGAAAVPPGGS